MVDDAGKKGKKAIRKLCAGVTLAYAGKKLFVQSPRSQAFRHSVLRESSMQNQTTLGTFANTCPSAQVDRITS